MDKKHEIINVTFTGSEMLITIDRKEYHFELSKYSHKLLNASNKQKENYIISPSGYGIHWPLIDEDLSIDSLLGIKHNFPGKKITV